MLRSCVGLLLMKPLNEARLATCTVCLDNTMEQIFHNLIKQAVSQDILNWNRKHRLGNYYNDGMSYSNTTLKFTTVPDGIFVSHDSLKDGLVLRNWGIRSTRLEGSPDMILEVINRSSVNRPERTA